jgi:hypothetical protein
MPAGAGSPAIQGGAMSKKNEGYIETTVDGQKHKGEWKVDGDLITVRYTATHKTTQLGSEPWPPTGLAEMLLRELVDEYKGRAR